MYFVFKKKHFYILWLFLSISIAIVYAIQQSIYIPLYQLDGAYQTASGLYRIYNGFIPGRDFFPYLGLLLTWILYPVFMIYGANLGASNFSAYFTVFLGTTFSLFTFFYFSRKNNTLISIAASLTFSIFIISYYNSLNISLLERVTPGNSLRPLRALVAPLSFMLLYLCINKIKSLSVQLTSASAISGVSMAWSNDFGYPTALMCGLTYLFYLWYKKELKITRWFIFGAASLSWYALALTIMTMGNLIPMIKYNMDIASDQGWYFNTGTVNKNVFSLNEFFSKFIIPAIGYKILAIPLTIYLYCKTKEIKFIFQFSIGISLMLGGIIPVIGGHVDYAYANAYNFWFYCVIAAYGVYCLTYLFERYANEHHLGEVIKYSFLTLAFVGVIALLSAISTINKIRNDVNNNPGFIYSNSLGGYLPSEWDEYLKLDLGNKKIHEDYWGLYSANNSLFSHAPTDSLIHALGSKRPLFSHAFKNSDIIFTASPEFAGMWMNWLLSANWDLYGYVLHNYRLERRFPGTDMWVKDKPMVWDEQECMIKQGVVLLTDAEYGFYEVSINYDYSLVEGHGFFMIKNNLNGVSDANGYVSINKNSGNFIFPVFVSSNKSNSGKFPLKAVGSVRGLKITSCAAKKISDPYAIWFPNASSKNIITLPNVTDDNWVKGVARGYAGFFIMASSNLEISVGDTIKFSNGEKREVTKVEQHDNFINVFLSGDKLDSSANGYTTIVEINK